MLVWLEPIYVTGYLVISSTSFPQWLSRPLCNCLVKKVIHGTDAFTHKHTELPAFSYMCSQPRTYMYEINYIDRQ